MILGLKTASDETELVLHSAEGSKEVQRHLWQSGRQLSDGLLPHIEQLLGDQKGTLEELSGVIVFRGPGSFTSLRIGVTMANTLAYSLDIPIVGAIGERWLEDGIKALSGQSKPQIITPLYGSEPHITKQKK